MIELFEAEYPGLFRGLRRLPRPSVAMTSPFWAALAAIGAAFLVSGLARAALVPLLGQNWPWPRPYELAAPLGTAAGMAVALRAGGASGAWWYVAYLLALAAVSFIRTMLDLQTCGVPIPCDVYDVWRTLERQWPTATGALTGVLLARSLRSGSVSRNGFLEGAGAFTFAPVALFSILSLIIPNRLPAPQQEVIVYVDVGLMSGAAVLAGSYVLVRRASRPTVAALVLAAVSVVAWLLPLGVSQTAMALQSLPELRPLVVLSPAAEAVLLVVFTFVWRRTLRDLR